MKVPRGKGRPSSCFITMVEGWGSNGQKTPQTSDCLHFILLIVGVASVAKCWRQKLSKVLRYGTC